MSAGFGILMDCGDAARLASALPTRPQVELRRSLFDPIRMSLIIIPGQHDAAPTDRWELLAVTPTDWFNGTNTRPLLVDARAPGGQRDAWVLKPVARLTVGESIKELVGYRMAEMCGIPVPEYGVLNVAEDRVRHLAEPFRGTLLASLGPNFGTRFMRGYSDLLDTLSVPPAWRPLACEIFAFDVGVDNADRRRSNSNLLIGDDQLLAIDHQHTFSWCVPTSTGPDRWTATILHRLVHDHFFGHVVFRWLTNYSRLRDAGKGLNSDAAEKLTGNLPPEWLARGGESYRDRIREYLDSLFSAWTEMLEQIEGHAAA